MKRLMGANIQEEVYHAPRHSRKPREMNKRVPSACTSELAASTDRKRALFRSLPCIFMSFLARSLMGTHKRHPRHTVFVTTEDLENVLQKTCFILAEYVFPLAVSQRGDCSYTNLDAKITLIILRVLFRRY